MRRILLTLAVVMAITWGGLVTQVLAQAERRGGEESELPELETDRDAFTPVSSTAGLGLRVGWGSVTTLRISSPTSVSAGDYEATTGTLASVLQR